MFTPSNQKKLTNVSVVTLKKEGRKYEIAVYPNKLYEYRTNQTTDLSSILHTTTIYSDVSKGETAKYKGDKEELIREILKEGHEQKSKLTREYEMEKSKKEIIDIIKYKVKKEGKFPSRRLLEEAINKIHKIEVEDTKRQSQEIIKKLTEEDGWSEAREDDEVESEEIC